jgi:hypothetical protein
MFEMKINKKRPQSNVERIVTMREISSAAEGGLEKTKASHIMPDVNINKKPGPRKHEVEKKNGKR